MFSLYTNFTEVVNSLMKYIGKKKLIFHHNKKKNLSEYALCIFDSDIARGDSVLPCQALALTPNKNGVALVSV